MAQPIVKLESISVIKVVCHSFGDTQWIFHIYPQDILRFQVPTHRSRWTYTRSLFDPKLITKVTVPIDLTAVTADPFDPVLELTEGSVISSADHPICGDRLSQRPTSPDPICRSIRANVNERTGRRKASPRPRDKTAYVRPPAARAARAYGHLDGKITTNEVQLGDLDGQVEALVGEMQDIQLEVGGENYSTQREPEPSKRSLS